jgi:sugar phosphate permease
VLGIGVAAQASFSAAISGLPVTGTTMRGDYHLSNTQLGLVMGAIYLGIALSEILWGVWTDRFGERRVLLVGLISTGAMLGLMSVAVVPTGGYLPALGLLVVGMLLIGALGGSINGSSGRAVMAWFPEGQRGLAMSIRQTAMPAGGAVGIAILPWLAATHGFRLVYLVLATLCLLTTLAVWRWLHEPDRVSGKGGAAAGQPSAVSPLRRWDVWRLALASALLTVPQFGILTFSAVFLHDAKHAGILATVLTLIVVQIGGGSARIWSGRFSDKHRNRRQMIKVFGLLAGAMLVASALLVSAPIGVVASTLALGGLFANAWHGVAYTEIASMAGASRAGTALGLENTTVFAMGFLTPLLVPIVLGASSWSVVWLAIGIASAAAVPLAPGTIRRATASTASTAPSPVPPVAVPVEVKAAVDPE